MTRLSVVIVYAWRVQTVMGDAWINFGYTDCLLSPYQPPDEPINTSLLGISPVLILRLQFSSF